MKSKSRLILALVPALTLSGGVYAYTFTTASGTINIAEPTGDIATSKATETQPDWNSILVDLSSENKTCGEVPTGNLFIITPNTAYTDDLVAKVYLTNTGNLTKAYQSLNMELYLEGSVEAGEMPNYRVLSIQNGMATFKIEGDGSGNQILSVTGGDYTLTSREPQEWEVDWTVTPELYCEVTQR